MPLKKDDETILRSLFKHASSFQHQALPNPAVGAMVVKEGKIIAIGIHKKAGEQHAEVLAINQVGKRAKGASLYVSLEPCSHHGKTPPCVDTIIKAGIKEVIYALADPNPLVKKRSSKSRLEAAGIRVRDGVLEEEVRRLHAPYLVNQIHKRPFFCSKVAMSLDGKIATQKKDSLYLTGPTIRRLVHRKREQLGAVLVGIGTLLADNPQLTVRHKKKAKQPALIILDSQGRLAKDARCLQAKRPVFCFVSKGTDVRPIAKHIHYIAVSKTDYGLNWHEVAAYLLKEGFYQVFVEGGQGVFSSLYEQGFLDQLICCVAPLIMAERDAYSAFQSKKTIQHIVDLEPLYLQHVKKVEQDVWLEYVMTQHFDGHG